MPFDYSILNTVYSQYAPSTIHTKDTRLFRYYQKYLFQKLMSVFEFKDLPENWAKNYFSIVLYGFGFIAITKINDLIGVVPQYCSFSGMDLFYQPKEILITNSAFNGEIRRTIGVDCEIIKMMPDYTSAIDIVNFYADMLALSAETAATNTLNSKLSYVMIAQNKAMAEGMKKMVDRVLSGEPAVVIDKNMMNDDGSPAWDTFTQDLRSNYIAGDILEDMKYWEDRFNTDIGIPNANTYKKERLIIDEVNANNVDTKSKSDLWLATLKDGVSKVNNMFGLSISVDYRNKPAEALKMPQEAGEENE